MMTSQKQEKVCQMCSYIIIVWYTIYHHWSSIHRYTLSKSQ